MKRFKIWLVMVLLRKSLRLTGASYLQQQKGFIPPDTTFSVQLPAELPVTFSNGLVEGKKLHLKSLVYEHVSCLVVAVYSVPST